MTAPGFLSTSGSEIIDAAGDPVRLTAVNWFGLETVRGAPDGLHLRNWHDMMDQMKALGFNAIRLPFSGDLVAGDVPPAGINYTLNPDLAGLSGLQLVDRIVDYAGQIGLRIILDNHRNSAGDGAESNGLWFDASHSEADWIASWTTLAQRYAGNPTVIGADLFNEPHGAASWGDGSATDWEAAAERAGAAIQAVNPDWLIIVQGIDHYKGDYYWWGGNLQGVADDPVTLPLAGKLVYSAHDYPNSIYPQPWFQAPGFGAALPGVFSNHWGFIVEQGIAPVFLGELGSKLVDPKDLVWSEALTAYLNGDFDGDGTIDGPAPDAGISWAWWSWNANSSDTGGVLQDDWRTPDAAKLAVIDLILGTLPIETLAGDGHSILDATGAGRRDAQVVAGPLGDSRYIDPAGDRFSLTGYAALQFIDGREVFDASDPAAQVMRLYAAALGRMPDQAGLNYWIDQLAQGTPLDTLAHAFAGSGEFTARYPGLDDAGFVELLYQNALGRASDAGGKAGWVAQLAAGDSRDDLLVLFSESAEHRALTDPILRAGIWDLDETAASVARLYDAAVGRLPDRSGLDYWTDAIHQGAASLRHFAEFWVVSPEFQATYGALGNAGFVEQLYHNTLDRASDAQGLAYWTAQLDSGATTRGGILLGFSESAEHQALTQPQIMSETSVGIAFV